MFTSSNSTQVVSQNLTGCLPRQHFGHHRHVSSPHSRGFAWNTFTMHKILCDLNLAFMLNNLAIFTGVQLGQLILYYISELCNKYLVKVN